jgi:hypothetical protein
MKLRCKKTTILAERIYYIEGKDYVVNGCDDEFYYVFSEKGTIDMISKNYSPIHLYFNDIFYTKQELRKLKLNKLLLNNGINL